MLDHAFKFVNKVGFEIGTRNFRSQKAVLKLGAVLQKEIIKLAGDGQPVPTLVFELTKQSWLKI